MIKKYKQWHSSLPLSGQLFVSFVLSATYWSVARLSWDLFFKNPIKTVNEQIFSAAFMGFFWTIFLYWSTVKGLFKKSKVSDT